MTRFFKTPLNYASNSAAGSEHDGMSSQDGFGPAIGLVLAAGTSLVLWFGLAHAASWAAHTLF